MHCRKRVGKHHVWHSHLSVRFEEGESPLLGVLRSYASTHRITTESEPMDRCRSTRRSTARFSALV
jgi:hypothetical protein